METDLWVNGHTWSSCFLHNGGCEMDKRITCDRIWCGQKSINRLIQKKHEDEYEGGDLVWIRRVHLMWWVPQLHISVQCVPKMSPPLKKYFLQNMSLNSLQTSFTPEVTSLLEVYIICEKNKSFYKTKILEYLIFSGTPCSISGWFVHQGCCVVWYTHR